jgi:acetoin utilization deacetylase AcuC-like enzyme
MRHLESTGLLTGLQQITPRRAEDEWLTAVHDSDYVQRVRNACANAEGFVDSMDTPVCGASYDVAILATGGVLAAVDAVVERRVHNAFCVVRPGGHHAMQDRAMGFCLFNHVAIAARYAQLHHGFEKILIVDWDVHHGNGTQAIFYDDPTVLFFSVHQEHLYPHSGAASERGAGRGLGYTINVPLEAGLGDSQYRSAFRDKLLPAVNAFRPDLILISAGFDAYRYDVLGRMKVTTRGFAELTRLLTALAREHCHDRLVSVLEGGYNLESLAACVASHVRVLSGGGEAE